jgi:ribosome modulation factor
MNMCTLDALDHTAHEGHSCPACGRIYDEGRCRFNCRTARQNWTAGFREAVSNTNYRTCDADEVYNEWKRRQETTG